MSIMTSMSGLIDLPSRERTRTILPWIAQETQYWSFRYILGTVYSGKTEASEMSPAQSQFQGSSETQLARGELNIR